MEGLTYNEHIKVHEITQKLINLSSPVLRLQAMLQFSQILDILFLGDTSKPESTKHFDNCERLEDENNLLREELDELYKKYREESEVKTHDENTRIT